MKNWIAVGSVIALAACGSKAKPPEPLANQNELAKDKVYEPPADAGVAAAPVSPQTPATPSAPVTPPAAAPAVTFELRNDGDSDLVFTTTKGWQSVLFAYTGKPPKAKTEFLFEAACTASCDAGDNACPSCPEPKNKKEELAMAKKETAAPG